MGRRRRQLSVWKHFIARSVFSRAANWGVLRATVFILITSTQMSLVAAQAESPPLTGKWMVNITFANGENRSLRFDAHDGGKGFFVLLDPKSNAWGTNKPQEARWTLGKGQAVTFFGPVEFPLGNVGRDPGTLTFTGKLEKGNAMTGEVNFSSASERPSKHGTFKATRVGGG